MPNFIQTFIDAGRGPVSEAPSNWNEKAIYIAGGMNDKQRHLYKKHKIVPAAFYLWMREDGIVRKNFCIPIGGTSLADLLDLLRWYPYENEQARSGGESLYRQIIKSELRPLKYISNDKIYGLSDHILDESKCIIKRREKGGDRVE